MTIQPMAYYDNMTTRIVTLHWINDLHLGHSSRDQCMIFTFVAQARPVSKVQLSRSNYIAIFLMYSIIGKP